MPKTIFQQIIQKTIPASIIFENKKVIAFLDHKPVNKGHFLVVPKKFSTNLLDIKQKDLNYLIKIAKNLAKKQIKKLNCSSYKLLINNGKKAGQIIFHTHIHIIPY